MNWQTKEILKKAKDEINDETVFSGDQIALLHDLISNIEKAIDKEAKCSTASVGYELR